MVVERPTHHPSLILIPRQPTHRGRGVPLPGGAPERAPAIHGGIQLVQLLLQISSQESSQPLRTHRTKRGGKARTRPGGRNRLQDTSLVWSDNLFKVRVKIRGGGEGSAEGVLELQYHDGTLAAFEAEVSVELEASRLRDCWRYMPRTSKNAQGKPETAGYLKESLGYRAVETTRGRQANKLP